MPKGKPLFISVLVKLKLLMGDFQIFLVIPDDASEDDASASMVKAKESLIEEGFKPQWFHESKCMKVKQKEKNCIYLFDPFHSAAFNHIKSIGCRILGPQCILTSLEFKMDIPRRSIPIYNLAMKDLVVCCSNIDKQVRDDIHQKVEDMGGSVSKDFTEVVTHLIVGEVGSKKYQVAGELGKQIMLPHWVHTVFTASKQKYVHATDDQFQDCVCPVFKGLVVTVSGLDSDERSLVKKTVEGQGGKYTGEMKVNECTHLIINKPQGQKYSFAKKWKIHIVRSEWLYDSVEKGYCLDERKFSVANDTEENDKSRVKTSTPEKEDANRTRMSAIADISCIPDMSSAQQSHINETATSYHGDRGKSSFNETSSLSKKTVVEEMERSVNDIDLTNPPADLFLDGCKIYLSGFRAPAMDKLRKVINAGGGIRLNQLSENVTHVVMGERMEKDIETLESMTHRPHVVTAVWLAECYKQSCTVPEENFFSPELPVPEPASPKLAGKKAAAPVQRAASKMSQDVPAGQQEEEFSDIMSQYLLQADQGMPGSGEVTVVNPQPGGSQEDEDLTQDPCKSAVEEAAPEGKIFWKMTFLFFGFIDESEKELTEFIEEKGGKVLSRASRMVPDFGLVPIDGFVVDRTVGEIVTNAWLQMCLEQDEFLNPDSNELFSPMDLNVDAQPLTDCVVSVSGYSGTERDCLVHIAELLGAKYQEYFVRKASKSLDANTHLVVREAEGSKYNAAKKWGIPALSKMWLFACAKSGQREPEDSYNIDLFVDQASQNETRVQEKPDQNDVEMKQSSTACDKLSENMQLNKSNEQKKSVQSEDQQEQNDSVMKTDEVQCDEDMDVTVDPIIHAQGQSVSDMTRSRPENSDITSAGVETDDHRSEVTGNDELRTEVTGVDDLKPEVIAGCALDVNRVEQLMKGSQKENMGNISSPIPQNNRVKELQNDLVITPKSSKSVNNTALETPSPTRFLDTTRPFRPKFDLTDVHKFLETPEDERKKKEIERKKRRSSLPLEELFSLHLAKAVKFTSEYKKKSVDLSNADDGSDGEVFVGDQMKAGPLQGVVIAVGKKLSSEQAELNNIVESLGGDYRWQYDSSCTHFIFQGRTNDITKEFRVAREQKKIIVSPHWVYMCKEQNAHVDESLFPHSYNPNLTLSGLSSKKSTPVRTTRRSVKSTMSSLAMEESEKTPARSLRSDQRAAGQRKGSGSVSPAGHSKGSESVSPAGHSKRPGSISPVNHTKASSSAEKGEEEEVEHMEVGGTVDMMMGLTKQLETIIAANKKKKTSTSRRNSKKFSPRVSGEVSSEALSNSNNSSRPQDHPKDDEENSSRRGSRLEKEVETNSAPEASQVVQITWDDPTGRLEQERLADKLARAMSPTQDVVNTEDFGEEFSDVEQDQALPEPHNAQEEEEVVVLKERVSTPEAPPIAFPVGRQCGLPEPPQPILIEDEENEQQENKPPMVFMLSGLSQEERVDFGALVEKLGGQMLDKQQYEPNCTHLVTALPTRNEKFLACVASGKWVLHKSYFEACRQENTFVQEEFYEWGGEGTRGLVKDLKPHEQKLAMAAHNWRVQIQQNSQHSSCPGAFSGWKVILCTDKKKEDNFKRLLQAGGAMVLNKKPPFTGKVSATHAFLDLNKAPLSEDCLKCLVQSDVICVKPEFIAAQLSDTPSPNLQDYCPSEVNSIMARLTGQVTGKKRTQVSSSSEESRSKRLRRK